MEYKFKVVLLEEANEFLASLEEKPRDKIIYNIWKSRSKNDPELFKKLDDMIWEFRTKYEKKQYRLLPFGIKKTKMTPL